MCIICLCQAIGVLALLGCGGRGGAGQMASVQVFERQMPWTAPPSLKADRMLVPGWPDYPYRWYASALWDVDGETKLVALRLSPQTLFGEWWDVEAVDKSGRVTKQGQIHCQAGERPFCLLEIKTDNQDLPPAYRNRWALAIGLLGKKEWPRFDPSKPFRFYAGVNRVTNDKAFNWIDVEPVVRDEDQSEVKSGVGILDRAKCECRPAERVLVGMMPQIMLASDE